ncbi:MAG TPA: sulfatase-like hydrolase/transferase [Ktedonobacteraceae bacterium]
MSVKPQNLLFIMSDQHNREMTSCYGHPVVKTPNLDRLAQRGVRFTHAYSNCPICVPSRASLATGRYVHQLRAWDNASPYIGEVPSWGHRLNAQGHHVTTVGKLHYRDAHDDTGFPDQRLPMHVLEGEGDLFSLIRQNMPSRPYPRKEVEEAHAGESEYTRYDTAIAAEACRWLQEEAHTYTQPWTLFVSLTTPHHPLIAPQEFMDLYPLESVIFPRQYALSERSKHPALEELRRVFSVNDEFDEATVRRAVAAYYALCSFMDAQVGKVLSALETSGLADTTRIIYTSDHGDTNGDHGLWRKHTMYEGSAGIPFIMAGPDLPENTVVETNISLVDCLPTILEAVGVPLTPEDADLPGTSLFSLAQETVPTERTAFSEYHAAGSITGFFMIRGKRYKYIEYPGYPSQLFDLVDDPNETHDLAQNAEFADVLSACAADMRRICDPEEINRQALADQHKKIEENGGEAAIRAQGFRIPFTPAPADFR